MKIAPILINPREINTKNKVNLNNKISSQNFKSEMNFGKNLYDEEIQKKCKVVLKESETIFKDTNKIIEKTTALAKEVENTKQEVKEKQKTLQELYNSNDPRLKKTNKSSFNGEEIMIDELEGYTRQSSFFDGKLIDFIELNKNGKNNYYMFNNGNLYKYSLGVNSQKTDKDYFDSLEKSVILNENGNLEEITLNKKETYNSKEVSSNKTIGEFYQFKNGILSCFSKGVSIKEDGKDMQNPKQNSSINKRVEFDENGFVKSYYKNITKTVNSNGTHLKTAAVYDFKDGKLSQCIKGSDSTIGLIGNIQYVNEFYTFINGYLTDFDEKYYSIKDEATQYKKFTS